MGKDFGSNVLLQFRKLRLELIADFDIPSHRLIMAYNTYALKIISKSGEAEEHTATLATSSPFEEQSTRAGVYNQESMRVRLQLILPVAHVLIDCILLASLIHQVNQMYRPRASAPPHSVVPVLLQDDPSLEWVPMYDSFPEPFMVLSSGNLPAGLLSDVIRPKAGLVTPGRRWDPVWFLLNETFSVGCWFLIGRWADDGHVRLGRILMVYAAVRLVIAVTGSYSVGWRIQALFWLCLGLWSVGVLLSRAARAVLRLTRSEAKRSHRSDNAVF